VSTLRVIAGSHKGHRIRMPKGVVVRPTSERIREALFAALGPLSGESVLDLFAGSGALGIEALSRGAGRATFVDVDRRVVQTLRTNLMQLQLIDRAEVRAGDYSRVVRGLLQQGDSFDLLFIDPPYRILPEVTQMLTPLIQRLLTPTGLVVIEGPRLTTPDLGLTVVFERSYGDTRITMASQEGVRP
jgi:16S rRNA (guanine966-N2)-methyltransferase